MAKRTFTVPRAARGEKLDKRLAAEVPGVSLERARRLLAEGRVLVDGKRAKAERKLWGGEAVEVELGEPAKLPGDEGPKLAVLAETQDWLVIDKPSGIVVEPGDGKPSVVGLLVTQRPGAFDVGGVAAPGVVHRLDRETSGCLVLAKTDAGQAQLLAAFEGKRIEKRYRALVLGAPPESGRIETPYARNPENPRLYTTKVASPRRAALDFKVVERRGEVTLLDVRLDTGRTHQIRVQLSDAGYPVLGDPLYGPKEVREHPVAKQLGRLALHAFRLEIEGTAVESKNGDRLL